MSALDQSIREQLFGLLEGRITIEELEEWMAGNTWDERSELALEVDQILADRHITTHERVCADLRKVVETIKIGPHPSLFTSATAPAPIHRTYRAGTPTITRRLAFSDN